MILAVAWHALGWIMNDALVTNTGPPRRQAGESTGGP